MDVIDDERDFPSVRKAQEKIERRAGALRKKMGGMSLLHILEVFRFEDVGALARLLGFERHHATGSPQLPTEKDCDQLESRLKGNNDG